MLLHSTDTLPFGKYRDISVGLIYLLSPGYIDWVLSTDKIHCCIGDIEFLQSLKVINLYGDQGFLAHITETDTDEISNLWADGIDFEDLKFSGFQDFTFSKMALENNKRKISNYSGMIKKRELTPEEDRDILIYYPGKLGKSRTALFSPLAASTTKNDRTVLSFETDNSSGHIDFLPRRNNLKVSSFFWPDWGISPEEMEAHLDENLPFVGQIRDGQLMLEIRNAHSGI